MHDTKDLRITDVKEILSPEELMADLPLSEQASITVHDARQGIYRILDGKDDRLVVMKKLVAAVDKVLPGTKAFRYMQIESKLAAIGRYELAKGIPLAQ